MMLDLQAQRLPSQWPQSENVVFIGVKPLDIFNQEQQFFTICKRDTTGYF